MSANDDGSGSDADIRPTAGILDLYRDVDDIRATGRTIVYCVSQEIGHLAIFVSAKVGAREDEEFVQLIDVIDCLPPGLFEMVIAPRPVNVPAAGFVTGDWIARFEARRSMTFASSGAIVPQMTAPSPQWPAEFKVLVRDQFFVLQLEPERAIEVLPSLLPKADARKELLKQARAIASAGDPLTAAERDRLGRLSQVLSMPIGKSELLATFAPTHGRQGNRQAECGVALRRRADAA
jgi:hypothetical protein